MTCAEVMKKLEKLGTAQNRKIYARHGGSGDMFGVSFANLYKLQKQIKTDHALARQLWKTRNVDAQWLATMIADPTQMDSKETDAWAKDNSPGQAVSGLFAGLVARTQSAPQKMAAWIKSKEEFTRATGYNVMGALLRHDASALSDAECRKHLATIEKEIHGSANRARYSMNSAVISIGIYKPALTKEVIEAAKRIGHVEVDHGETGCKTPDALAYIKKAIARKK